MAALFRCQMANLETLMGAGAALWRSGRIYTLPIYWGVAALLCPLQCFMWVGSLPGRLSKTRRQRRLEKYEQEVRAEGRDMYQLW